jgi:[ribosomal protein S5]-alanine N-acetyltransferase
VKTATDTLLTPRLALRRFTRDDLDLLYRLHSDPRVMRYTGGVKTRAESDALVQERIFDYYEQNPGLGMWATLERATGACIGIHLLNNIRGESFVQVGYILFAEFWGRGYATEMCTRILRYAFTELGLPRIVAITDRANRASQHVLEKSGLERNGERTFAHPAYRGEPQAWFERDAAPWLAER